MCVGSLHDATVLNVVIEKCTRGIPHWIHHFNQAPPFTVTASIQNTLPHPTFAGPTLPLPKIRDIVF